MRSIRLKCRLLKGVSLRKTTRRAGLQGSAAASKKKRWQIFMDMPVSVIEARAINDHRIVEKGAVAFFYRGES